MTGVIAAPMGIEAAAVRAGLRGRSAGRPPVLRTGTGTAPRRAQALAGAPAVVVAGVCGALVSGLAAGDVVVPSRVLGPGGEVFTCPAATLLASALREAGLRVHEGPLVSAAGLVHGRDARARLAAGGAVAVDLETAPLLASCDPGAVLAVVRVVVDSPDHPLLRAGTVTRGVRALRALRAAAPAMADFLAAAGERTVLLAEPRSFCAGVERAIGTVERVLAQRPGPVYVRRQIVHNTHVVADLQQRGAVFVTELDEVPPGSTVVLAAHGVAPAVRQQAQGLELRIVDATCPLVTKVHTEARRAAERGDTVVLIGHRDHEEVEGTVGEAPGQTLVVDSPAAVSALTVPAGTPVSYLMQTTLAVDEAEAVAAAVRDRFPQARGPASEDICYATSNRQAAVREVGARSDVVLVVGSANSSNSVRLVEVAERCGAVAHLLEDVSALRLEWLVAARTVGVTAGASAPPALVDEIVHALRGLGPTTVSPITVGRENVAFEFPREVRP